MSRAILAIWYENSTLSSSITCITRCIPVLSNVSQVISMHAVVVYLVVRLLLQFLCNFLVQGGEVFAVPFGRSSFVPLGKGSLHTLFLHVPCLIFLFMLLHMFSGL